MKILVLGGTRFVGRTVVAAALARGDDVTTLNRGVSAPAADGVEALTADRTDPASLRRAVGDRKWDAVVDTWAGAGRVVSDSCSLLAARVEHYAYVSSWAVYRTPIPAGADERTPTVEGDPDDDFYPTAKRAGEVAVLEAFADRALIARAGPTLGPHEDVGSMTWWLRRIHRGGRVVAPGDPGDPFQYVDVRDLAAWLLAAAERGVSGAYNTVSPRGCHTMGELLRTTCEVTGSRASLVWVPEDVIVAAGVRPYADLPLWLPSTLRGGLNDVDASAARSTGLDTSRPLRDTLADTWSWLQSSGEPADTGRGLDRATERRVLDRM